MVNILTLPLIRLAQRLSMILTVCCFLYVVIYLFSKDQDNASSQTRDIIPSTSTAMVAPVSVLDLNPYVASPNARDIFSMDTTAGPAGTQAVQNTPKGQLPDHLKVVGILVADPAQIIIEDTSANTTYFIEQGHPQAGIRIVRVNKDQMIINYQGQDIPVPIHKN